MNRKIRRCDFTALILVNLFILFLNDKVAVESMSHQVAFLLSQMQIQDHQISNKVQNRMSQKKKKKACENKWEINDYIKDWGPR